MKLQQLALGARFEYEGVTYVKTGPMTGTAESGGQRLIPRYAVLKPLDGSTSETPSPIKGRVEAVRVRSAFERFYETTATLVAEDALPQLAEARASFLEAIK